MLNICLRLDTNLFACVYGDSQLIEFDKLRVHVSLYLMSLKV